MTPQFDTCLVCEGIREEVLGKLTLLGFFGICPNVDIGLQSFDQPATFAFLVSGGRAEGLFAGSVDIYDETIGRVIASTVPGPIEGNSKPNGRTTIGVGLVVIFGHPGMFTLRVFVEGAENFRTTFRISAATPSEAIVPDQSVETQRRAAFG